MAKSKKKNGVIVTGVKAIDRKLRRLEYKLQRKILRKAMDKALKPVLEAVKANAPVDTGELRDNIKIRAGKSRKGIVRREIRVGDKQIPEDFPGAFVEFGTHDQPAHPFMGPAFESKGPEARDRVIEEIFDGLKQEVNKGKAK